MIEQADGKKWGDPIESIDESRRKKLMQLEDQQQEWVKQPESERGASHFEGEDLNGAEVFFLAAYTLFSAPHDLGRAATELRSNVVRVNLGLHLEGANLNGAVLNGAILAGAHLNGAVLSSSYLAGGNLMAATLNHANIQAADLSNTNFDHASLSSANLTHADLSGAKFIDADLSWTTLRGADLSGTALIFSDLSGADLRLASMTRATKLSGCTFTGASFDQLSFGDVNLTTIEWDLVDVLGDEHRAKNLRKAASTLKSRQLCLVEFQAATRAYRALSVVLQSQGLTREASRFVYRAQLCQREVLRLQGIRKWPAYLGSLFLWIIAGYGYKLWRILVTYVGVLAFFALFYFFAGQIAGTPLSWPDAILVSFTAVHGRVFLGQFGLHSVLSWIAGIEAVTGIVIEGVFVAMLIQKFFSR